MGRGRGDSQWNMLWVVASDAIDNARHNRPNCYRCNWWVKEMDNGITAQIVRSRFLKAVQTPDGLLIEDLTA
jgi:hypothetical protein